ncbi:hypothetical protein [Halomonas llamarensis]|uniref:Uncharacterized protein n=1 Tax=Halomonas llamarensis TaxID=2945104 RepID=A0ABT0SVQ3_9GAMM|nr:hypothetical protein [Halomonas llamarensis]MCL7931678.1 hypothetical protein [Halomonas llamarensis]
MKITWEDRKNSGRIDDHVFTEKPPLSFKYAWFLVTGDTAQFVESHEKGYYNKDMSGEQREEVIAFYQAWTPPAPPEPQPLPEPEYFTYKTDIWTRCTEDEAETLDAALSSAPAKQRRMWDDSLSVEHSSDYYTLLRGQMESVFGAARTAEMLAPSN